MTDSKTTNPTPPLDSVVCDDLLWGLAGENNLWKLWEREFMKIKIRKSQINAVMSELGRRGRGAAKRRSHDFYVKIGKLGGEAKKNNPKSDILCNLTCDISTTYKQSYKNEK